MEEEGEERVFCVGVMELGNNERRKMIFEVEGEDRLGREDLVLGKTKRERLIYS